MILSSAAVRRSSDARAFRFLLICLSVWLGVRMMTGWDVALPAPSETPAAPRTTPPPFLTARQTEVPTIFARSVPTAAARRQARQGVRTTQASRPVVSGSESSPPIGNRGADLHRLRLAMMARLMPPQPGAVARSAVGTGTALWFPLAPAAYADPGQGKPFWIQRQLGGWALGSWLYLREGSGNAAQSLGGASQLGGSQAGLRLAYGFGDAGRARVYGRATIAVQRSQQRELAFGLAFAPLAHLPLDVAIEQRVAVGKDGRTALAMMASGGVSDVALPAGFRLDAYGQAGVVGLHRRDGFADGAVVVDRRLGPGETSLRLGALAAGAVQPGAARVDVGPRLTFRLPEVGEGSRIALDWRQRVAGDARPESGLALTLAADF